MGLYGNHILPRLVDFGMRGEMFSELRPRAVGELEGRVLEIGFGSGLNLPHYGSGVTQLLALEPAELGRKLARKRIEASGMDVEFVGLDGANIPLGDDSIDAVACTWTLCTIPAVQKALSEVRRVLRPGARFHFLEHGHSRDAGVARWQDRINPMQKFMCGGCHLNRKIDELVRASGLEIRRLDEFYMKKGPRFAGYMYEGFATK